MRRRVVITGMGTVNALATDLKAFWEALCAGRSGVSWIEQFDASAFKVRIAGEVKGWDPERVLEARTARRLDRFAQFALVAGIWAVEDSGLTFDKEDAYRCGVILGTGIGGMKEFEEQHSRCVAGGPSKISPFMIPKMIPNAAAGNISIHFGLCGPNTAVSTACASAAHAVGDALRIIQLDQADVMIAGGTEAVITVMGMGGFVSARALSTRNDPATASRPFDKERDGFVLSEGAGVVVLEELEHARKRSARLRRVAGLRQHGRCPSHHGAAPVRGGSGQGNGDGPARRPGQSRGGAVRQRPRHEHPAGRRGGNQGHQAGVRRARPAPGGQQHQEHARPHAGSQRRY